MNSNEGVDEEWEEMKDQIVGWERPTIVEMRGGGGEGRLGAETRGSNTFVRSSPILEPFTVNDDEGRGEGSDGGGKERGGRRMGRRRMRFEGWIEKTE
jgi:hypothetical protein